MKKILVLMFFLFFWSNSFAEPIKDIVIFGDSLSDDGNLYRYLKILPKSPPYYQGRFSNGETWAEHVGKYFYKKSFASYSNYAYGGATAILHQLRTDSFVAPVILSEEIHSYLLRTKNKDKSHTLYGLWIGANDYLYDRTPDVEKLTDDVVAKTMWGLTKVIEQGGKHFFVMNLPDLSQIPFARNNNNAERLGMISRMHNQKLATRVKELQARYPNVEIMFVDIYSIFSDILKYPEKYNDKYGTHVTDIINSCWLGDMLGRTKSELLDALQKNNVSPMLLDKTMDFDSLSESILNSSSLSMAYSTKEDLEPCANPDDYLFWDDMHPTAVIHGVLGKIVVEMLEK